MWLSFIENPEGIQNIFFNKIPSLKNVSWKDLKIENGQEINCQLSFDIWEMPAKLPEKWKRRNVNTIQISLNLTETEILFLDFSDSHLNGVLTIEPIEQHKRIVFSSEGKNVFIIKSKWVYINSIVGYMQGDFE